jgi:hypothetical protein
VGTFSFLRKLTEIKWEIKETGSQDHISILFTTLISHIQTHYGKCHPFISDIYELQSLYHLSLF